MVLESEPATNDLLGFAGLVLGAALMWFARGFPWAWSNETAGFLLGVLVTGLSLGALVVGERRTVTLDVANRQVVLQVVRRIGSPRQVVMAFPAIEGFSIAALGSRTSGSRYYDLVAHLRDGREVYLFGGCAFAGRMDRDQMEALRHQFSRAIGVA